MFLLSQNPNLRSIQCWYIFSKTLTKFKEKLSSFHGIWFQNKIALQNHRGGKENGSGLIFISLFPAHSSYAFDVAAGNQQPFYIKGISGNIETAKCTLSSGEYARSEASLNTQCC
ncbi:hypothetical protein AVEN_159434-1 [Araneus ventricosus]|uniref:Uncharacterized protein n=1 Tax=Araneus ventricosus TaxID=182803 RepID=A0A4Y2A1K4_ARAVE|nr:hypothetical protein AVEN_159434-1 [Araneus ventricosus]